MKKSITLISTIALATVIGTTASADTINGVQVVSNDGRTITLANGQLAHIDGKKVYMDYIGEVVLAPDVKPVEIPNQQTPTQNKTPQTPTQGVPTPTQQTPTPTHSNPSNPNTPTQGVPTPTQQTPTPLVSNPKPQQTPTKTPNTPVTPQAPVTPKTPNQQVPTKTPNTPVTPQAPVTPKAPNQQTPTKAPNTPVINTVDPKVPTHNTVAVPTKTPNTPKIPTTVVENVPVKTYPQKNNNTPLPTQKVESHVTTISKDNVKPIVVPKDVTDSHKKSEVKTEVKHNEVAKTTTTTTKQNPAAPATHKVSKSAVSITQPQKTVTAAAPTYTKNVLPQTGDDMSTSQLIKIIGFSLITIAGVALILNFTYNKKAKK